MTKELSKTYNPENIEQKWYKIWEDSDCFKPNEKPQSFEDRIKYLLYKNKV